jgi:hypothetical protein
LLHFSLIIRYYIEIFLHFAPLLVYVFRPQCKLSSCCPAQSRNHCTWPENHPKHLSTPASGEGSVEEGPASPPRGGGHDRVFLDCGRYLAGPCGRVRLRRRTAESSGRAGCCGRPRGAFPHSRSYGQVKRLPRQSSNLTARKLELKPSFPEYPDLIVGGVA